MQTQHMTNKAQAEVWWKGSNTDQREARLREGNLPIQMARFRWESLPNYVQKTLGKLMTRQK